MKHPPVQYPDDVAKELVEQFILGDAGVPEDARPSITQIVTVK
jgi:hypothetical protein